VKQPFERASPDAARGAGVGALPKRPLPTSTLLSDSDASLLVISATVAKGIFTVQLEL
jgi:hypothetical protein